MKDNYGMMVCSRINNIDYLFLCFFLDFQSGTIIEKLNRNTHVYQYTINSMVNL